MFSKHTPIRANNTEALWDPRHFVTYEFLRYVSSETGNVARLVISDQSEHDIESPLTRLEYCKIHLKRIETSLPLGLREDHRKVLR